MYTTTMLNANPSTELVNQVQLPLGHKSHQIRSPGAGNPRNSPQFPEFPTHSIENQRVIQPLGYLPGDYIGANTVAGQSFN